MGPSPLNGTDWAEAGPPFRAHQNNEKAVCDSNNLKPRQKAKAKG